MRTGKILGAIVAAATATLLLAGCGGSTGSAGATDTSLVKNLAKSRISLTPDQASWITDTKKPAGDTITWFVDQSWWNPPAQSKVAKQFEKDLHVKINYISGDDTKLNTFFASGKNMPDIITLGSMTSQAADTASKWALPLNQLATKYDPYWNKVASAQTMDWYKLADGNTYGYPGYSNTDKDYASGKLKTQQAVVIRKDVYEALGEPKMDTQASFLKVLGQIKDKYPSLLPFGFSANGTVNLDSEVQDLLGVPYYTNGKLVDRNMDPDYQSWLKTLRQAHQEGYISDDTFTDANDTSYKNNLQAGKFAVALVGSAINYDVQLGALAKAHPDQQYVAVTAFKDQKGRQPVLNQAGISGWMPTYITKQAKDPQACMEFFTYMQSPYGQMLTNYGWKSGPDQTYTEDKDGQVHFTKATADWKNGPKSDSFNKQIGIGQFYIFGHDSYKALDMSDSYSPALTTFFNWGKGYLTPEFPTENTTNFPAGSTMTLQNTNIGNQWQSALVSAVRAPNETAFKAAMDKYTTFRQNNGWDQIQAKENQTLQSNLKRLGMSATASTPAKKK